MKETLRRSVLQSKSSPPPPPRNFRPAGKILHAFFTIDPPLFSKDLKVTGSRAAGIRYENKVQRYLLQSKGDTYVPGPWFRFRSIEGKRFYYCQPDGLDFNIGKGLITIVEVKLQHTSNAWWQTRKLYEPVLKFVFPERLWSFAVVEIVRWYDPDTNFPEEFTMIRELTSEYIKPGKFHVHIWNGKN
jgi:hypothetical protein